MYPKELDEDSVTIKIGIVGEDAQTVQIYKSVVGLFLSGDQTGIDIVNLMATVSFAQVLQSQKKDVK